MKLIQVLSILAIAIAAFADVEGEDLISRDYHRRIGIPRARQIKTLEEQGFRDSQRIVGGVHITDVSIVPYQVGLIIQLISIFTSICGGSLISNRHVLTAALCYSDDVLTAQYFTVVLGSSKLFSGGLRLVTNDIILHPDWPIGTITNDIAILTIPTVTFTSAIQPIALPSGTDANSQFVGNLALVSGYGRTWTNDLINQEQDLHVVQVQILPNEQCIDVYGSHVVQPSKLCTSGEGAVGICGGDFGGPLALNSNNQRILVGIASFHAYNRCEGSHPSGFTRITSYLTWIEDVMQN